MWVQVSGFGQDLNPNKTAFAEGKWDPKDRGHPISLLSDN